MKKRGFTLVEAIIVMVLVGIVASIGGYFFSVGELNFLLEAEQITENFRWAQNQAISRGEALVLHLATDCYRLTDGFSYPVNWPPQHHNCSDNICRLEEDTKFATEIKIYLTRDGRFMPFGPNDRMLSSNISIQLINRQDMVQLLFSTASGFIGVGGVKK